MKHIHPISGQEIVGERLQPSTEIKPTDRYDSTDGKWRTPPFTNMKVPVGSHVIWVRPEAS